MASPGPVVVANPSFARVSGTSIRVPVFFHVITAASGNGDVTRAQIEQQMLVLNQSFAAGGLYSFELVGVSRVVNDGWFNTIRYSGTYGQGAPEREAKLALGQDTRHILNIYTADLIGGQGFATFPFEGAQSTQGIIPADEDYYLHGVMADYTTLPGGTHPTYNLGDLIVHEVGHYLGLYHPDEGYCSGDGEAVCDISGDTVCDTPQLRGLARNSADIPFYVCGPLPDNTRSFMNYTEDTYRSQFTSGQHQRTEYVGREGRPSLGMPSAPERVSAGVTVTLEPGAVFRYWPGESLAVFGTLAATGVTLAERDATQGWGGVRAESGAVVSLSNVIVDRVGVPVPPPAPPTQELITGAIEAHNATLTLSGVTVQNTGGSGLVVSGSNATATVTNSIIQNSSRFGVVALGGAQVAISGSGTQINANQLGGVQASSFGTTVTVFDQAHIDGNLGYGVTALGSATVTVATPAALASGNTSVSSNRGGLASASGGFVDGGICSKNGCTHRPNRFNSNNIFNPCSKFNTNGTCDARATGTSAVVAEYAFWNGRTSESQLSRYRTSGSVISVEPLATTLTALAGGPVAGRGAAGSGVRTGEAVEMLDLAAGRGTAAVALASEARQAAAEGDAVHAFELLADAVAAASGDDDLGAVYSAAASLVANPALAGDAREAFAASLLTGTSQPWAARTLAVARATSGDAAGAGVLADALTTDADAGHRAAGHGLRVRLAVEAGDEAAALSRLDAFAASVTTDDADGLDALGSATALAALAFPDAFPDDAPQARGSEAPAVAANKAGPADATEATLSAWPNPSAGAVSVRLAGATGTATVAVYDALGRRVALLHDGTVPEGGVAASLDGAGLPAGIYVVHARVTGRTGAVQTLVQRVTLTR